MKDLTQKQIGFTQGVVYAIAQVIRYGHESVAEYLWNESGFTSVDLSVCDEYDLKELRKAGIGE